ncbi:hypothetical protein [Rahnella sp. PCH160]|uniref:hypothetical protein n=1 Tax=Rahnella sp. PCH160 TaxID=3447928 RepID=UPI0039FC7349
MKIGTMMAAKIKLSNNSNMIASLNWLNGPKAVLDFVLEVKTENQSVADNNSTGL